ncbi:uncharacterized protein LOC136071690 [Hydra vulgaris]|uniref:uncharacterized protein LOC136071690 n=1 Tax=Hydra vulgaris TaxID=6087 RepID=UPI0032EA827C
MKRRRLNKSMLDFIMTQHEVIDISTNMNRERNASYEHETPCEAPANIQEESALKHSKNFECFNAPTLLKTETLSQGLAKWSSKSNISQSNLKELLNILRRHGHSELPKDGRSLLKSSKVFTGDRKCGGTYAYFTIADGLNYFLNTNKDSQNTELSVAVNVNGLPLFKSSNLQLWPILGLIENYIFIIALFCENVFNHHDLGKYCMDRKL